MKIGLAITILLSGYSAFSQPSADQPGVHYRGYDSVSALPWQNIVRPASNLIISAEIHEVGINTSYYYSLFEYLSKNGYRNIILEAPYSLGFFANEYLSTGNDSLLNIFCNTEESAQFWKKMHALNESLPADDKIQVLAVDFELDQGNRKDIFIAAVQYLVHKCESDGKVPPASIAVPVAQLPLAKSIAEVRNLKNQLAGTLNNLDVQLFLDSCQVAFELLVTRNDKFGAARDKTMFDNFMELYNLMPAEAKKKKFYAQFGWGHVRKSNSGCLAMLFQKEDLSPFKNHTFLIGTQYINCYSSMPGNYQFKSDNSGVINDFSAQKQLENICTTATPAVKYVDDASERWKRECDALMVFYNYGGTTFRK